MPSLVLPRRAATPSVRAAAREFGDDPMPSYSSDIVNLHDDDLDEYVEQRLAGSRPFAERAAHLVPGTHLWWVEGTTYLGRVHIRHRLTPRLRDDGGHLGYHVVPTYRRRGHATAMLAAALPVAAELGIDCLLLTCDPDNEPSRKVIERNGGLLHDQRGNKLRYWVPTG